jgi:hypothetical protein
VSKSGNPAGSQSDRKLARSSSSQDLSPDDLDAYEERAAILEFDAEFARAEAERRARQELRGRQISRSSENNSVTRLWPDEKRE